MGTKAIQLPNRETQRMKSYREELLERIARAVPEDGLIEPLAGLRLYRASSPTEPLPGVSDPTFCVIAQGSKEVYLGTERYRYDPYHYCLGTVELPIVSRIVEASKERPYLSLVLRLDPSLVGSVMIESGHAVSSSPVDAKAFDVSPLDAGLLDAVVRLVRLLDHPEEASFIAPLIKREIIYRLLRGKQGDRLRHIAILRGYTSPIARAIELLRRNFDQPLRIDEIAREVGMSVSGLHHHFKAVTAMSPLQFQKRIRLQEARRLMLHEGLDAASAGFKVGYNDPSHFNREYKKLFGLPPLRDVERLRGYNGKRSGRDSVRRVRAA
ncbi:AraC family transcriptional regulator [Pyrinomonas methylaliphatogenes]|uniref:Transcriptional regulator, AraC family n=1 Tax=Pyrinomonas methylaliphatogenes TaxID=454194 RepID=A0A0B6WZK0_9BACT|nr:AraC family transcriptional regulator [Pyrinomonas methylaliphatogenes]CDM66703.1 transcriptional regulator, AraC family [Pyrinomonas methylaliphatogenes]